MPEEKSKEIPRRKFVQRVLAGAAGMAVLPGISTTASAGEKEQQPAAFDFLAQPYLQNLRPTSVTIHFILSGHANAWVEYNATSGQLQKAQTIRLGLTEIAPNGKITLSALKPGTSYSFKVVSKEIVSFQPYKLVYGKTVSSKEFQFTTPVANAETVNCLILNDIHDRPESFQKLIDVAGNRSYDSVILNGDMFDYMTDENQVIKHLLTPCAEAFASIKPFYFLRGNHETRGVYARGIEQYFSYSSNSYYFAEQIGPVFFIFLDTGEDKPDDAPVYANIVDFDNYRIEQANWLKALVQTKAFKKVPFRVVVMHIPPYHSGDWHGTMHCRKLFSPIFEKHKIDMVISGHTHKYGIHAASGEHKYPIIIGGGPKDSNRTVIHFTANRNAIDITMLRDDGSIVGNYNTKRK